MYTVLFKRAQNSARGYMSTDKDFEFMINQFEKEICHFK